MVLLGALVGSIVKSLLTLADNIYNSHAQLKKLKHGTEIPGNISTLSLFDELRHLYIVVEKKGNAG